MTSGGESGNRLRAEKSPYLLQHAQNPVDWYPWGPEAFATARRENKPIFLSIGYSTCHWCHVMEHESFEDTAVARLMNETFVSIKVDREERPDIDNIYMSVCQMMTGGGGWPLTIIMTPDQKPFFAGTYFPRESRHGRIGMMDLVPRIREAWRTRRADIDSSASQIAESLQREPVRPQAGNAPGLPLVSAAVSQLAGRFDSVHGGFGQAPKFPTAQNLMLLLRYWKRTGEGHALEMAEQTLTGMRRGGICDHIGFGFHRYSTDREWLLPHFEKMLYDQAMLCLAYLEAYQATRKSEYAATAREILAYVRRDMTDQDGGFHSAEDADSDGEEGKFYVWTTDEIRAYLSPEDAALFIRLYNLEDDGNYLDQATQERTGACIPHVRRSQDELARREGLAPAALAERLDSMRETLFAIREKRIRPHKDDKVLTDWNGLMIAAFARAARVLDEPEYAGDARRAADFVLTRVRRDDGRLLHRYRDGEAAIAAHLDDYAFLIWGLIELYEASFDPRHLQIALDLNDDQFVHFWDDEAGGFCFTADDAEELIARTKETYDGAIPSGNSVALNNLLRLARLTGREELAVRADRLSLAFGAELESVPSAHSMMLCGVDFAAGPTQEIVIAGDPSAADTKAMLDALRGMFLPSSVVLLRAGDAGIAELAPFTRELEAVDGKATAYVCENFACQLPVTTPGELAGLIGRKGKTGG